LTPPGVGISISGNLPPPATIFPPPASIKSPSTEMVSLCGAEGSVLGPRFKGPLTGATLFHWLTLPFLVRRLTPRMPTNWQVS
jgi:hypothetical protein